MPNNHIVNNGRISKIKLPKKLHGRFNKYKFDIPEQINKILIDIFNKFSRDFDKNSFKDVVLSKISEASLDVEDKIRNLKSKLKNIDLSGDEINNIKNSFLKKRNDFIDELLNFLSSEIDFEVYIDEFSDDKFIKKKVNLGDLFGITELEEKNIVKEYILNIEDKISFNNFKLIIQNEFYKKYKNLSEEDFVYKKKFVVEFGKEILELYSNIKISDLRVIFEERGEFWFLEILDKYCLPGEIFFKNTLKRLKNELINHNIAIEFQNKLNHIFFIILNSKEFKDFLRIQEDLNKKQLSESERLDVQYQIDDNESRSDKLNDLFNFFRLYFEFEKEINVKEFLYIPIGNEIFSNLFLEDCDNSDKFYHFFYKLFKINKNFLFTIFKKIDDFDNKKDKICEFFQFIFNSDINFIERLNKIDMNLIEKANFSSIDVFLKKSFFISGLENNLKMTNNETIKTEIDRVINSLIFFENIVVGPNKEDFHNYFVFDELAKFCNSYQNQIFSHIFVSKIYSIGSENFRYILREVCGPFYLNGRYSQNNYFHITNLEKFFKFLEKINVNDPILSGDPKVFVEKFWKFVDELDNGVMQLENIEYVFPDDKKRDDIISKLFNFNP